VISDAHEGLKAAIRRVFGTTWQRCRVHWMRSALAHVPKGQQTMVAAALRQAFLQPDAEGAHRLWRQMADQFRPRWPKLAALMDDSEHDVLAYMAFPAQHRAKLHSTDEIDKRVFCSANRAHRNAQEVHSFVRLRRQHSSVPTRHLAAAARRGGQGWPHLRPPSGLALSGPSTAASWTGSGLDR
jgi:transposase-like protein